MVQTRKQSDTKYETSLKRKAKSNNNKKLVGEGVSSGKKYEAENNNEFLNTTSEDRAAF